MRRISLTPLLLAVVLGVGTPHAMAAHVGSSGPHPNAILQRSPATAAAAANGRFTPAQAGSTAAGGRGTGASNSSSSTRSPGRRPTRTSTTTHPPGEGGDRHPRPPRRRPPVIQVDLPPVPTVSTLSPVRTGEPALRSLGNGRRSPAGAGAPGGIAAVTDQRFVPDEILVDFARGISAPAVRNFARSNRLALLGTHRLPLLDVALYHFRITDRRAVPAVLESLRGDRRLAGAQPNYVYALSDEQARSAAADAQYVVEKLHLTQAHSLATGGGVLVALIDSAVDKDHPELRGGISNQFDTVKSANRPEAHGTAMASAILAHARLVGVAPGAAIAAVRAFATNTSGAQSTTIRLLEALQWTATSAARVVNMSFTGPSDPELHAMIGAVRRQGIVLVGAAGNRGAGAPPEYPAAYPEVIAVTATDMDDHLLEVANRGSYVAVAAPGVDVFVAAPNGGYDFSTGTSVATAHVSGLVALLLQHNPRLTPDAVRNILVETARDLGAKGRDDEFGAGLVDAYQALMRQSSEVAEQPATR